MSVEPEIVEIRASGKMVNPTRTDLVARHHFFRTDEPRTKGGTDAGPTPMEMLLGSYAGCTAVIANIIAKEMNFDLRGMEVSVKGLLDYRGIRGTADVARVFPEVQLRVEIQTSEPPERVGRLREELARRCPASRILQGAGAHIKQDWHVLP